MLAGKHRAAYNTGYGLVTDGPYNLDDYADDGGGDAQQKSRSVKRKTVLKGLPGMGDPPAKFAAFLTDFARLDEDPVVSAERWGTEGSEPIELVLRSGKRIGWQEQDHLFSARLQRPLVLETGHQPRALSPHDASLVAWAIVHFATLRAQIGEADEFKEWWEAYLAPRQLLPIDRNNELTMRATLAEWRQLADVHNDKLPYVLRDRESGERWARRLDFAVHVRSVRRAPMSWQRLNGLSLRYGWQLDRIQYRPTAGGAPYVDAKVFVVPADWEQNV